MEGENNLSGLKINELRQLVIKYPWFSWAREVLLYKVVEIEPDVLEYIYGNNLVFFPNRNHVLYNAKKIIREKPLVKTEENVLGLFIDLQPEEIEAQDCERIEVDNQNNVKEDIVEVKDNDIIEEQIQEGEQIQEEIDIEDQIDFTKKEEIVFGTENKEKNFFVVGGDYFTKEDFKGLEQDEEIRFSISPFNEKSPLNGNTEQLSENKLEDSDPKVYTETLAKIYADQGFYNEAIDIYAKLILLYPEKSAYFASLVKEIKLKN